MKRSLVLLSLVILAASVAGFAQKDRKYIVLKRATPAAVNAPFSEAVRVGDTLYISGHIGFDPATGKPGATPEQEARLVMDAIQRTVEAAGMSMDDVVQVQVYCTDVSLYDTFNSVYRSYFHGNYPARAFLGSGKLLFGARYEVMGLAVKKK
ncbi:MAG TPA: RidA family protein [Terriglobales bacterium]|jgi:reactive intermediate/imine deaminase|nr:RidA family protein [Terriglobales bacterium]